MATLNIVITGAGGRIAYALIPLICSGSVFGEGTKISLRLLDIESATNLLQGVKLEIEDCGYDLVSEIIATTQPELAFRDVNVAVLLGGFPRLPGMERRDLIAKNVEGMHFQARALDSYANRDCKVLVVANPANTNCLVAIKSARNISPRNFSCLTRLDHERLRGIVASKLNLRLEAKAQKFTSSDVKDVFIFGNHSSTQVPYFDDSKVNSNGESIEISPFLIGDFEEIKSKVQNRGAEIIQYSKASSALSAANAISKHLRDWLGPATAESFSIGILSDGNPYGVPDDLVCSFPCRRAASGVSGELEIIPGLAFDERIQGLITTTIAELLDEKVEAQAALTALV